MAGWESFLFGWGDLTLDLEAGDAIAGGEDIFAGELRVGGGGGTGVFESPRLRRKLQPKPTRQTLSKSVVLTLGPGDAIASGEPIGIWIGSSIDVGTGQAAAIAEAIAVEASAVLALAAGTAGSDPAEIRIEASAVLELELGMAGIGTEAIEVAGEHRGVFVVAGDVARVTRGTARLRMRDDGLLEAA
jgi:hypothetical protein